MIMAPKLPSQISLPPSHYNIASEEEAKLTPYVLLCCLFASSASFIFGYDLVIAGGIGIMDDFLLKFYPKVLEHKRDAREDVYCKYRNAVFQFFSSSLYLGALLATLVASIVTSRYGRKSSMLIAGLLFIMGTLLSTFAPNIFILISGRALLGCGLGFSNQVVSLYVSEIAPPPSRGAMNYFEGIFVSCGILSGNIVNYFGAMVHPWGWRISLGVVGAPALLFTLFVFFFVESPTFLMQQGHHDKAKFALTNLRGSNEVNAEFEGLMEASKMQARMDIAAFWTLLTEKSKLPQLVIGMALPFFQRVSGNDAILFYGVFLFKAAGFKDHAALYSAIIIAGARLLGTSVALFIVDRVGRRKLLLGGAMTFSLTMVIVALIFALGLKGNTKTGQELARGEALWQVIMLCVFGVAFGSSLGPLAYIVPSEIYDVHVRSVGMSITVCVNMLFKFILAQTFLSLLCALKYGVFLLFATFMLLYFVFIAFFIPETKCIPLHGMQNLWVSHWFWKRFVLPTAR